MEDIIANKDSWKNIDMPVENTYLDVNIELDEQEIEILKKGHIPEAMEDHWFMYFDDNKLYIHRSWTGFCIYIVFINENGNIEKVQVNRNIEQYNNVDDEQDKYEIARLIYNMIGKKEESQKMLNKKIELFQKEDELTEAEEMFLDFEEFENVKNQHGITDNNEELKRDELLSRLNSIDIKNNKKSYIEEIENALENHSFNKNDKFLFLGRRKFLLDEVISVVNNDLQTIQSNCLDTLSKKIEFVYGNLDEFIQGNNFINLGNGIIDGAEVKKLQSIDDEYYSSGIISFEEKEEIIKLLEAIKSLEKSENDLQKYMDKFIDGYKEEELSEEDKEFNKYCELYENKFGKHAYIAEPSGTKEQTINAIKICLEKNQDILDEILYPNLNTNEKTNVSLTEKNEGIFKKLFNAIKNIFKKK